MKIKTSFIILLITLCTTNSFSQKKGQTIALLDKDLSNFDTWLSIPHTSVEGLPEGTFQGDNVGKGTPIGLNNNLKNVFSMIEEDGEPVLKITGEIFGCVSSKASYENYHLSVMFKWGEKKWIPRVDKKRDSGILYHCYGEHGMFLNTWKMCLEYQVQETDLGDFIPLSGGRKVGSPTAEIRGDFEKEKKFNPNSEVYSIGKGYINAASEHDKPHGEWNHLEIYIIGDVWLLKMQKNMMVLYLIKEKFKFNLKLQSVITNNLI